MANNNVMGCLCLAILVSVIFNASHSTATSAETESNSSTSFRDCSGSMLDCRIADDVTAEFFLDSEMVQATINFNVKTALNPNQAAADCGRGINYKSCLVGDPRDIKKGEICYDTYGHPTHNRGCH